MGWIKGSINNIEFFIDGTNKDNNSNLTNLTWTNPDKSELEKIDKIYNKDINIESGNIIIIILPLTCKELEDFNSFKSIIGNRHIYGSMRKKFTYIIEDINFNLWRVNKDDGTDGWVGEEINNEYDFSSSILYNNNFHDCKFIKITFNDTCFNGFANFLNTTFKEEVSFKGAIFKKHECFYKYNDTTFKDYNYTNFNFATFNNKSYFYGAKFFNKTTFSKANFEDNTYFNGAIFYSDVTFLYAKFFKSVFFEKTTFRGVVDLRKTNIEALYFQNIKFGNLFFMNDSLIESFILGSINFIDENQSEIKSESKILDRYKGLLNKINDKYDIKSFRKTCCLLKDTYTTQSNHIDSNIFYALEMVAYERELETNSENDWIQKLIFKINKLTSNHCQSVLRPTITILTVAIISVVILLITSSIYSICIKLPFYYNFQISNLYSLFLNIVFPPIFKDMKIDSLNFFQFIGVILIILAKIFNSIMYWQLGRAVRKNIKR